jgi:trimeric autotransporter adhesin
VGDEAGTAITTGDYNTAVGYKALFSDTLGNRSTAIGREALLNQNFTSDTDAYNIAVGYGAGLNNATGYTEYLFRGVFWLLWNND